jgi:hypothetical protein
MINAVKPKTKRFDYNGFAVYLTYNPVTSSWEWNAKKQIVQVLDFKGTSTSEALAMNAAKRKINTVIGTP